MQTMKIAITALKNCTLTQVMFFFMHVATMGGGKGKKDLNASCRSGLCVYQIYVKNVYAVHIRNIPGSYIGTILPKIYFMRIYKYFLCHFLNSHQS